MHEFKREKSKREDVQEFAFGLEEVLFALHDRLRGKSWIPDPYVAFPVTDPKLRLIHKASVRDRVLYQGVHRQVYPVFDRTFIHDSYASRVGKGVLAGVIRLQEFVRKASKNYTRRTFVLKCDIRKFFDSIDHVVLLRLLRRRVEDAELFSLLSQIVSSLEKSPGKGLPLGNVTSQLFANVYLNELDTFMKRALKQSYYIRYCDDFVCVGTSAEELRALIPEISVFLEETLHLHLHPRKVSIRALHQGVDFLGYVALPHLRTLRTQTKRRMFRRCGEIFAHRDTDAGEAFAGRVLASYKGLLSHSREYRTWKRLERLYDSGFPPSRE